MELKNTFYLLLVTMAFAVTACNNQKTAKSFNPADSNCAMSKEDSAKIAFYDKYFLVSDSLVSSNKNRPVNPDTARECTMLFDSTVVRMDPAKLKQMLITRSVSFNTQDLTNWMSKTLDGVNYNNIRVCFGVYNKHVIDLSGKPQSEIGRLTVYLWPYLDGKEPLVPNKTSGKDGPGKIEPFNFGNLQP